MNIVITINTDNAAFEENPNEVSDILHQLADNCAEGSFKYISGESLRDSNGNTVGGVEAHEN